MKCFKLKILERKIVLTCVLIISLYGLQGQTKQEPYIKFDDTRTITWPSGFEIVSIPSSEKMQKAYFFKANEGASRPLVVSLHTWSGDYRQKDDLATLCKQMNLNYIHPDFQGANKKSNACCSKIALEDIDNAIAFAISNGNVDSNKVYVIGVSGGGYATLSTFMKSRHRICKFSAWASITDLGAWYNESVIMKDKYASDILACTDSRDSSINVKNAQERSPLYMRAPVEKLKNSKLLIHVGVYDGIQGSVPITHSINFYNKLLSSLGVKDKSKYVSEHEILQLLEFRRPIGNYGKIGDRMICLKKNYQNVSLIVFVGEHEMLTEFALNEILN